MNSKISSRNRIGASFISHSFAISVIIEFPPPFFANGMDLICNFKNEMKD
jgi:hypothetical protein